MICPFVPTKMNIKEDDPKERRSLFLFSEKFRTESTWSAHAPSHLVNPEERYIGPWEELGAGHMAEVWADNWRSIVLCACSFSVTRVIIHVYFSYNTRFLSQKYGFKQNRVRTKILHVHILIALYNILANYIIWFLRTNHSNKKLSPAIQVFISLYDNTIWLPGSNQEKSE